MQPMQEWLALWENSRKKLRSPVTLMNTLRLLKSPAKKGSVGSGSRFYSERLRHCLRSFGLFEKRISAAFLTISPGI